MPVPPRMPDAVVTNPDAQARTVFYLHEDNDVEASLALIE